MNRSPLASSMTFSLPLGRLAGVPVRVHTWFAVALLGLLGLASWSRHSELLSTVLVLALALIFLLVHEGAHAWAARRHSVEVAAILLGPFYNAAWLTQAPPSPRAERGIAAAGPLANLALLLMLLALREVLPPMTAPWGRILDASILINLAMSFGNLVPAFPLDGSRVLRAHLGQRLPHLLATRLVAKVGTSLALGLPLLALSHPWIRSSPLSWPAVLAACYGLWRAAAREQRLALVREIRQQFAANPDCEIDVELRSYLSTAEPPPPNTWRWLTSAQFRTWKKNCEDALRAEMELLGAASRRS